MRGWIAWCRTVLMAAVLVAPGACTVLVDADQERLCRLALPALNAEGADLQVVRVIPGERSSNVRIEYRATDPDRPARNRVVICRFAGSGINGAKAELLGIATERGPMPDASFFFLKRFYLESPETAPVAVDRLSVQPPARLPGGAAFALQQAVSALPNAVVYGLIAGAYALIFGLIGRLVLGLGEFAAVGGGATLVVAAGLAMQGVDGVRPLIFLALLAGTGAAMVHGLIARLVVAPLMHARGQHVLIATVGLGIALSEYLRLAQGAAPAWIPALWANVWPLAASETFVVTTTPMTLVVAGIGGGAILGVIALLRFGRFGRAWRAHADDALAAGLFGIDGHRLLGTTVLLACGLCGLAGVLTTLRYGTFGFAGGFGLGLKALIAAVIGGIGSVEGAFVGGLLIALAEGLWSAYAPIEARDIALYVLLVAFLIWRPGGLFGYADLHPRRV